MEIGKIYTFSYIDNMGNFYDGWSPDYIRFRFISEEKNNVYLFELLDSFHPYNSVDLFRIKGEIVRLSMINIIARELSTIKPHRINMLDI